MPKMATLCGVTLLALGVVTAWATPVNGVLWTANPQPMGTSLPGLSIQVEAGGHFFEYEFQCWDEDRGWGYVQGVLQNPAGTDYYDRTAADWTIRSSPQGYVVTYAGRQPPPSPINRYVMTGYSPPSRTDQITLIDDWGADDEAATLEGDEGSRDDQEITTPRKQVVITPDKGWIEGTVLGMGRPVSNATVKLFVGTAQVDQKTTGPDGKYKWPLLAPGAYTVKALPPAQPPASEQSQDVYVSKGAGATANFWFAPPGP